MTCKWLTFNDLWMTWFLQNDLWMTYAWLVNNLSPEIPWDLVVPLVLYGLSFCRRRRKRAMLDVLVVTLQHFFHKLTLLVFFQFKIEVTTQIFCLGAQTCPQFLQVDFRSPMEGAEIFYHMKFPVVYLVDADRACKPPLVHVSFVGGISQFSQHLFSAEGMCSLVRLAYEVVVPSESIWSVVCERKFEILVVNKTNFCTLAHVCAHSTA